MNAPCPKFRTATGHLTRYALACGYISETTSQDSRRRATLAQADGGLLSVEFLNRTTGKRVWMLTANLKRARLLDHGACQSLEELEGILKICASYAVFTDSVFYCWHDDQKFHSMTCS